MRNAREKVAAERLKGLAKLKKMVLWALPVLVGFLLYHLYPSKPNPKIQNVHPTGENIICFGDSLTFGTGAAKGMDFPAQLSNMISRPVLNKGVPGDTTARALARLDRDVLSQSPRIVLITLGGNDLKNGVPKETVFQNLRNVIQSIQAKGALVILGGIDLPIWGRGYGEGYEQLCKETGALLILNIFDGIMGNMQLMSDSIHPNDAGYTKMAQKFYEALKPYL
jgi:acyl-CoA thioesterase I